MPKNQPDKDLSSTEAQAFPDDSSSIPSNRDETEPPPQAAEVVSLEDAPIVFDPPAKEGEVGTFGRYRVLKQLGQGGMGAVYLAFDQRLARKVALKVMLPKAAKNAKARDRFVREAKAAAQISDDHVVAIHEADEHNGTPFIALQYLEGTPLDQFLKKKGNVSIEQAVRIALETARGLEAAHKLGLVHRDIKPSNLWLEAPKGRVKILDFGLARQENEDVHLTQSGAVVGTPAYMSPEQARGEKVDSRTDLFSLGSVLYRLTTGEMPFKGKSTMAVLTSLAVDDPIPVRQLNPNVPEALENLIHRLLSKNSDQRPRTAGEVAKRLEEIQKGGASNDKPRVSQVEYVPLAVSVITEDVWAGIDDEPAAPSPAAPPSRVKKKAPVAAAVPTAKAGRRTPIGYLVAIVLGGLLVLAGAAAIIIKIKNKDGSVTELKVPDDAEIEVNGKNVTPDKTKGLSKLEPLPPWTPPPVIPIGDSPYDKLDPNAIPKEERFEWQPRELVAVIGTHARRHWEPILSVAMSPDGKMAASGSGDMDHIITWDVATQSPIARYYRYQSWLQAAFSLQFSTDGKRLFTNLQGNGHGFRIVDLTSPEPKLIPITIAGKQEIEWFHQSGHFGLMLESAETFASWTFQGQVTLFDWHGGAPVLVTDKMEIFGSPVFVPKLNQMIYVLKQGKIRRATIKQGKIVSDVEIPIPLETAPTILAIRDDGKRLAFPAKSHTEIWDIDSEKPKRIQQVDGQGKCVFSPDGRWMTMSSGQTAISRIDGPEPKFVAWLDRTGEGISEVAFSRDGNRVIVGNSKGFARFWDLSGAEPKELSPLDTARAYPMPNHLACPQIDPQSGRLLIQNLHPPQDGSLTRSQLWDFANPTPGQVPGHESPLDASYGRFFPLTGQRWMQLTPYKGSQAQRYEIRGDRWQPVGEPFGALAENVSIGAVSGDGKSLIQLTDVKPGEWNLHGWDVMDKPVKKWSVAFPAKAVGVPALHSSWNGASFAVFDANPNGAALSIYRNTGAKPELTGSIPIKTAPGHYHAALSPDGKTLAHTRDSHIGIVLEDIGNGRAMMLNRTTDSFGLEEIFWLAFSPDGKHLAYATYTGVGVLNAKTLKPVYQWKNSLGYVNWVAWAPDGRHLVTHNGNKTVYVLRLNKLADTNVPTRETREPVGNDWVDLLGMDEKLYDTAYGNGWDRIAGKWVSRVVPAGYCQLGLPLAANGGYDLEAEATIDSGSDCLAFQLPVGGRSVQFGVNHFTGQFRGLHLVNAQPLNADGNPTRTKQEQPLKIGTKVAFKLSVRLKGDQAEISATVDGGKPITWSGPVAQLSRDPSWVVPEDRFGVITYASQYTLQSLRFKKFDGQADLIKKAPLKAPLAGPTLAERKVAEWVLSKGGTLANAPLPDEWRKGENVTLPSTGPVDFNVINLNLASINDEDLARLKDLRQLFSLVIRSDNSKVTEKGISQLAAMPWASTLRYLDITNAADPKLTDEAFAEVAKFPNLRSVVLAFDPKKTTGRGLARLKGMEIKTLHLSLFDLEPTAARHLRDLPKLNVLGLEHMEFNDALAGSIGELTGLQELVVSTYGKPGVTDAGLKKLTGLKKLETLAIANGRMTNEGLRNLLEFSKLKTLRFVACGGVDDSSLNVLSELKTIKVLAFTGCPITDAGLKKMADWKHLKNLDMSGSKVTAQGVQDFRKARPDCAITSDHGSFNATAAANPDRKAAEYVLSIGGTVAVVLGNQEKAVANKADLPEEPFEVTSVILQGNQKVTDAGMDVFKGCRSIRVVYLNATGLTDAGLANLKDSKKLVQLLLNQSWNITDKGLETFNDCPEITYVDLTNTQVSDAGLLQFNGYKSIKWLFLGATRITDAGLASLQAANDLRVLSVSHTKVSDIGLSNLKELKKLERLDFENTKITDAGLAQFGGFKNLTTLNLKMTKVTAPNVEALHRALPKCRIEWDGGVFEPKP